MAKRKEKNFPKRADLFREKILLKHLIKALYAIYETNHTLKCKVLGDGVNFITKIYGEEWRQYITNSEKFDELIKEEEEKNDWVRKACAKLIKEKEEV